MIKHDLLNGETQDDTICLFRAVGEVELRDVLWKNAFSLLDNGSHVKYFGLDFDDTLKFANLIFNIDVVAILEVRISTNIVMKIGDFTHVDSFIFRNGTVEIHREHMDEFNKSIISIRQVF